MLLTSDFYEGWLGLTQVIWPQYFLAGRRLSKIDNVELDGPFIEETKKNAFFFKGNLIKLLVVMDFLWVFFISVGILLKLYHV